MDQNHLLHGRVLKHAATSARVSIVIISSADLAWLFILPDGL
jgi:hypothetical protein